MTAAAASADGTRFVTAGADRTVACWDARALASSVGGGHKRALTASFGGQRPSRRGWHFEAKTRSRVAGGRLGVFSLAGTPARTVPGALDASASQLTSSPFAREHAAGKTPAWIAAKHVPVAPLRIRTAAGAKEKAPMSGVALLPRSRLFVVATEDGVVKMCR